MWGKKERKKERIITDINLYYIIAVEHIRHLISVKNDLKDQVRDLQGLLGEPYVTHINLFFLFDYYNIII